MKRPNSGGRSATSVARHSRHAHLNTHIAETLCHILPDIVYCFWNLSAGRMPVAIGGLSTLAAQQLIHGQPRLAALNIPESHVHPGDCVVQHWSIAPISAIVAELPRVIDPVRWP